MLAEIDGAVVGKDVFLDGLVHVSTNCQEVLGVVFVTAHLLDARSVPQQTLLVAHVALNHLLVTMMLLDHALVDFAYVLNEERGTSCNFRIY